MSKAAEGYRKAAKAKIGRLLRTDPKSKIDASGYTPPDALEAEVKTGARPVSKRLYKRGGKVHGEHAHHHAGRKARKSGGKAITADSLVNRDVREANEERSGPKHVGAFKKGGRAHKFGGGPIDQVMAAQGQRMGSLAATQMPPPSRFTFGAPAAQMSPAMRVKKGGKVARHEHPDEAEDKALIRKMVKPEARTGKKDGGEKWISKAIKHPGALHKSLHVPEGEKIPAKKLEKAAHSSNPKLAKRAHLAETLKRMHKDSGGPANPPKKNWSQVEEGYRPSTYGTNEDAPGPSASDKAALQDMIESGHKRGGHVRHDKGCKCHRCMGGKTAKSHGGQAEEVTGTRPTGGRTARATGGKAGKGKMNVNIIISGHGHRDQQQPMMPPGAAMPPPRPGAVPMPMPGPGGGGPMGGAMPMPVPMPMQAAAPPPAAVPPMRASGGGVFPHMENGGGGGLGRLEKIKKYGP